MRRFISLALLLAALAGAQSRQQIDPTMVSNAPATPVIVSSYTDSAIAGGAYSYKQGNFLYVTADVGTFSIFDVSIPAATPVLVGQLTCPSSGVGTGCNGTSLYYAEGVVVVGRYAYVAVMGNFGLSPASFTVIDVNNPTAPNIVASISDATKLDSPECLAVYGTVAYVTGYNSVVGHSHFTAIDISTPTSPVVLGVLSNDNANMELAAYISIQGQVAFVTSRAGAGYVAAIDISTPASMSIISQFTTTLLSYPTGIDVRGSYAVVAGTSSSTLLVLNVSNPASMSLVGHVTDGTLLPKISNVHLVGSMVYATTYGPCLSGASSSLAIVDISTPASPAILKSLAAPNGTCFDHLDISGRYGYQLDDGSGGLYVIDFGGLTVPVSDVGRIQAGSADVTQDLRVGGNLIVGGGISQDVNVTGGTPSSNLTYLSAVATGNLVVPYSTWTDIPGATVTLNTVGTWWLFAAVGVWAVPADGNVQIRLNCNGTPIANPYVMMHLTGAGITSIYLTVSNQWIYGAGGSSIVCKLQGSKDTNGGGGSYVYQYDTSLMALWLHS